MRVAQAASLVQADKLSMATLWTFTTTAERIQIALILGQPTQLPIANTPPMDAWLTLDRTQRTLVLRLSPLWMSELLSASAPEQTADPPRIRRRRRRLRARPGPTQQEPTPAELPSGTPLETRYCW
ncbi:hypothetical protein [Lichenicola sp.]|uniref:hypothetical protein n=1 Tax=Lichenicola sp. TaxID=2804529 RepID=UPI003AFFEA11